VKEKKHPMITIDEHHDDENKVSVLTTKAKVPLPESFNHPRAFKNLFPNITPDDNIPDDVIVIGAKTGHHFTLIYFTENRSEQFHGTYDKLIRTLKKRKFKVVK